MGLPRFMAITMRKWGKIQPALDLVAPQFWTKPNGNQQPEVECRGKGVWKHLLCPESMTKELFWAREGCEFFEFDFFSQGTNGASKCL